MTTFHPESGRLRTTTADFVRLLAHLQGATTGRDADVDVADLVTLGVLDDSGAPHRLLAPAVSAALHPLVKTRVRVCAPDATVVHPGWAHLEAAAVLAGVEADAYDLVTVTPPHLPSVIARLVGLGPRPVQDAVAFDVDAAVVDALFAEDPGDRLRGATTLASALPGHLEGWRSAIAAGAWKAWEARATWAGPAGPTGRRVVALDSPAGFLLVGESSASTRPVLTATPARLWAGLVHLLPESDELAAP